jgi:hypothetical protein
MELRNSVTGERVSALITVNHAASSYGIPVLVVRGEALGTIEAAGFELVEATDQERLALARGGYRLGEHRAARDEAIEHHAQNAARHVLAGRDPAAGDWHEAGYASARKAAEVLVGSGSGDEWERTVEIVAEALAAEGGVR